jgi:hypothetical protein
MKIEGPETITELAAKFRIIEEPFDYISSAQPRLTSEFLGTMVGERKLLLKVSKELINSRKMDEVMEALGYPPTSKESEAIQFCTTVCTMWIDRNLKRFGIPSDYHFKYEWNIRMLQFAVVVYGIISEGDTDPYFKELVHNEMTTIEPKAKPEKIMEYEDDIVKISTWTNPNKEVPSKDSASIVVSGDEKILNALEITCKGMGVSHLILGKERKDGSGTFALVIHIPEIGLKEKLLETEFIDSTTKIMILEELKSKVSHVYKMSCDKYGIPFKDSSIVYREIIIPDLSEPQNDKGGTEDD